MKLITDKNDPILKKISEPVDSYLELRPIVDFMLSEMEKENALGIAAVQVGVLKRMFIFKDSKGHTRIVINPRITKMHKRMTTREGCLSVDLQKVRYKKKRFKRIDVEFTELLKCGPVSIKARFINQDAIIFQHEYDHLEGILINA